jgi:hypothetical protein
MSYKINDQEFAAVSRLSGRERYGHFIKRVADWEEVWGLRDEEGWAAVGDDEGRSCFPVWPHPRYAEALATGEWATYRAAAIPLGAWLEDWLPGMDEDGVHFAVFPTPALQGVVVSCAELRAHLEHELALYE